MFYLQTEIKFGDVTIKEVTPLPFVTEKEFPTDPALWWESEITDYLTEYYYKKPEFTDYKKKNGIDDALELSYGFKEYEIEHKGFEDIEVTYQHAEYKDLAIKIYY